MNYMSELAKEAKKAAYALLIIEYLDFKSTHELTEKESELLDIMIENLRNKISEL